MGKTKPGVVVGVLAAWVLGAALASMLAGCAAEVEKAPVSCRFEQRAGTYLVAYSLQSGTCGIIETSLVSLNPQATGTGGPACSVTSERITEGQCKLERTLDCGDGTSTIVSRDVSGDGSQLEGTLSLSISGRNPCHGTYAVSMVRQ